MKKIIQFLDTQPKKDGRTIGTVIFTTLAIFVLWFFVLPSLLGLTMYLFSLSISLMSNAESLMVDLEKNANVIAYIFLATSLVLGVFIAIHIAFLITRLRCETLAWRDWYEKSLKTPRK